MAKTKKIDFEKEDKKIVETELVDEMKRSYIDYSMSVITSRALPDVRDGLKPVHRRILYGMHKLGLSPMGPHKKSARIVGEVMGKYHAHGDTSIYDAMVRMSQDFSMRYPLVDGHGNFGSIDGDEAASMRYTEARMSPFSLEITKDIEKDTVDFMDNFDGEEREPTVLPSRIPNILINGSSGIAVGMATNIPPHNLDECIDACICHIDNPDAGTNDLMKYIKGPDFPTGGIILGKDGIKDLYTRGEGKIKIRARCSIEPAEKERNSIVVSEIPYQVNKARLVEKISELSREKAVEGIYEIRDESSREGMRIVIETKKSVDPQIVLNNLLIKSPLQVSFSANLLAISKGTPKIFNLKDLIEEYVSFQEEVLTRRTSYELRKAEEKKHILEGLIVALENIDEIISIIKGSTGNAKEKLISRFKLSERQAQAILDMKLASLQKLEKQKIIKQHKEIKTLTLKLNKILKSKKELKKVLKTELIEMKEKWGDKRKTFIGKNDKDFDKQDLIMEKNVSVLITKKGYVKMIDPSDTDRAIERIENFDKEDFVIRVINCKTTGSLVFFTNIGRAYAVSIHNIQDSKAVKGVSVKEIIPELSVSEKVISVFYADSDNENYSVIFATNSGMVKRSEIKEFNSFKKGGVIAIGLKSAEEVINVVRYDEKSNLLMTTLNAKAIQFPLEGIRVMGRAASGVKGVSLEAESIASSAVLIDKEGEIVFLSENGYIKKISSDMIPVQARGGKGLLVNPKNKAKEVGNIVSTATIDAEKLYFTADDVKAKVLDVKDIPLSTRAGKFEKLDFAPEKVYSRICV